MGRRRKKTGRPVSGILLLDKPRGISSNKALQQVKNLYKAQKAGHTGSLDPLATGVLPVCLGEATKVSGFLLDADKKYRVQIKLGEKTTTADAEGEVIATAPIDSISETAISMILPEFIGVQQQLPPMYSALKHNGERLYKLAREGIEVERKPREITIFSLELISVDLPFFELDVHCSKGTYVRTLAEDIGEKLGCGAHVTELRRTAVGIFDAEPVSMAKLESAAGQGFSGLDPLLMPIDSALPDWEDVHLSADMSYYVRQGQAVMVPKAPANGMVRLYDEKNGFLGVGVIQSDGKVAPKRLMLTS
ncbi:MAG: tRNA pseudouridine(55) synthase TruB [Gammaproteobacteria bacterium]|nr:tRNA pseudouridine(55) synthase TruB [Gammaproteobacteria bacterium]